MKNNIECILKIIVNTVIVGIIIVVVANLFMFLLPFILIGIIAYYLYKIFLEAKIKVKRNENNNKSHRNIKNVVEEAEIVKEKFDK